ncbi:1-deoxy-D-xylulose 5-phosphate reductoisomerase 2 [Paenibacillus sp. J31TS4]|uniref:1-deoxy-D-xylulose-5-phosphate reductoisomerase n=1 Tax=Paenibacillus sp. J31TS4 TaxID=2807195 RepID=UPI001B0F6E01|nr:1-deoxy-D-xylulose-5-phosphate reductoisomerase [Paenibacillus sp. J31TS4]GIP36848.1 1-deoxy-D-xylulose 5-phosphate reductoisomerase 2 [Paenibacillus sp. J31TS4]
MRKKIAVLGSTGSIGTQSLNVISHDMDRYTVEALAAGSNLELFIEQIRQFQPRKVSVATKELAEELALHIPSYTEIYYGEKGMIEVAAATDADLLINAVMGSQGLRPTMAAIEAGKSIALANKETLVSAGHLVTQAAAKHGVKLLPVDSEHSAIFQCLNGEPKEAVSRIILTASGGSFRDRTREQLADVTVEEALKHPNWSMGAKITIDSATMVNKGLEVIEAHWLFRLPYDRIEVLLHPESVIHSMVEFADNSVIAQLGNPDMRVPIQYALTYPERRKTPTTPLNLAELGRLHFREMDYERFPCLRLAFECGSTGGTMTTVYNAANEVAVDRFLRGDIKFLQIEETIERVLEKHQLSLVPDLDEIQQADAWARQTASSIDFS